MYENICKVDMENCKNSQAQSLVALRAFEAWERAREQMSEANIGKGIKIDR